VKKNERDVLPVGTLCSVLAVFALLLLLSACSSGGGNRVSTPTTTPTRTPTSTPPVAQTRGEWFQGGTLHSATLEQWRLATSANRLATAADWLASTTWKGHLNTPSDFDRAKVKAQMLVRAVNEVASDRDLGFVSATETAAAIILMSNDLGP